MKLKATVGSRTRLPITYSKSGVSTNGALSRFTPWVCRRKELWCSPVWLWTLIAMEPRIVFIVITNVALGMGVRWRSISYQELFLVSQEVAKVNVEEVSWSSHHNVVVMTITNALQEEEEGGERVMCTVCMHPGSFPQARKSLWVQGTVLANS